MRWPRELVNQRKQEKLESGEAIDLSNCEREGRYYVVPENLWDDSGVDYCDSIREAWIWSIGRRYSDGVILADTSGIFYQNNNFQCLWLR